MEKKLTDILLVHSERHDVSFVLRICAVAALGGILFGYDTSVIAGAIEPMREFFHLTPMSVGWAVSNVIIGCVIGALFSGWVSQKLGRRMALFLCAILFSIQSLGTALAPSFAWFVIFRMLGGVAVGVASAVSPMYMSEVSPKDMRGRALSMEQFAIVFGQVIVYIANYLIAAEASALWLREMGWRWMFASELIPCVIFCATVFLIPESPRWHVLKGRKAEALKTLTRISNAQHATNVIREIEESIHENGQEGEITLRRFFKDNRAVWIVFVALMIAGFQQTTGINAILYFAPMLLKSTSGSLQAAMFQTIWIGVALLIGGIFGAWVVDTRGRKPLMRWGATLMVASMLVVSWALYTQTPGPLALFGMLAFMVAFGFSWGPLTWILISELFPNRMRSFGMSIAVASNWVANFLVAQFFPILNQNPYLNEKFHGAFSMWIFAAMGTVATIFVLRFVPETKGVSLEKIENVVIGVAPKRFQAHNTRRTPSRGL